MTAAPGAIRRLEPGDSPALLAFFQALSDADRAFFHPHPFDESTARAICSAQGKDVFVGGFEGGQIAAYGMLRGWEDGFDVPRLGLATRSGFRGCGWGDAMMDVLHRLAAEKGASKVELKVEPDNAPALRLYRRHGYVFPARAEGADALIGRRDSACA